MAELKSRFKRGMTTIEVPCNGNYASFVYPGEGSDTYQNVFSRLIKRGLRPATGDETASLLYTSYCDSPKEPESKEIREIMRTQWLWVPNRNLWVAGENPGVYVVYDKEGVGRSKPLNIGELEEALQDAEIVNDVKFSKDRNTRFAPRKTYQDGIHKPEDFVKNGYVIASYGIEGAEKLKEVAKVIGSDPKVWIVEPTNVPELRVSALGGGGGGLRVYGGFGDNDGGHAFGVFLVRRSRKFLRRQF